MPHLVPKLYDPPEVSFHYAARIEPGAYPAYCRSSSTYWDRRFKRWVCALQFNVLANDLSEMARLTLFLNLGTNKERPRIGRMSNYWKAWTSANGGQPTRNAKLSDRIFLKRYARILVADTEKNHLQRSIGSDSCYSVVRDILSWDTGSTINQSSIKVGTRKAPQSE